MRESERRWLLKALREAADELVGELYDLDPAAAAWRPSEDEWSLLEVAAHLRSSDELALAQLQHLSAGEATPLPVWDVETPAAPAGAVSLHSLLRAFLYARQRTSLLLWELTPTQWTRQGLHPYRGPISLGQIARDLAEHDLEHLWQVRRYKGTLGGRSEEERS